MVNTDVTKKGISMHETCAKTIDSFLNMYSIKAGLLRVQVGFELIRSSVKRNTGSSLYIKEENPGVSCSKKIPGDMPALTVNAYDTAMVDSDIIKNKITKV